MKPRLLAFYRALIALLGPAGFCEVNALHAEGRCIASQFCVRVDAEYAVLKIGFDERYARVAPGQLLLERTLQQCCGDPGIRRVNLISDATWHRDWRPDVVRSYAAYVGLGRWSGRPLVELLRARLVLGPRIRKLVSRSKRTERA